jgi:agmatinase
LPDLDYRHPERFLGLDDESSARETSAVWVLPIPYEMTTSYAGGAKLGPAALIDASTQVELYDAEIGREYALEYGIHTLPTLHPTLRSPEAAIADITAAVSGLDLGDRLLVTLGGEHSITPGVIRALAPTYPDLIIVQIDAHSDLRDEFDGTPYSHACAIRRALDYAPVVQFGIRSICREEADFLRGTDRVTVYTGEAMHRDAGKSYLAVVGRAVAGRPVYLTIDVDGLDPSVIPATGTPEPGGIGWYDCLDLIRTVAAAGRIIGIDCVELAPTLGSQAANFAAAKLVYKAINYTMRGRS